METNVSAENFYQLEVEHNRLGFDSSYAVGIFNSFKRFDSTRQELKNFQVYISHGSGKYKGMIKVSFLAKRVLGTKQTSGGKISLGSSLVVYFSPNNGELTKVAWSK